MIKTLKSKRAAGSVARLASNKEENDSRILWESLNFNRSGNLRILSDVQHKDKEERRSRDRQRPLDFVPALFQISHAEPHC